MPEQDIRIKEIKDEWNKLCSIVLDLNINAHEKPDKDHLRPLSPQLKDYFFQKVKFDRLLKKYEEDYIKTH